MINEHEKPEPMNSALHNGYSKRNESLRLKTAELKQKKMTESTMTECIALVINLKNFLLSKLIQTRYGLSPNLIDAILQYTLYIHT